MSGHRHLNAYNSQTILPTDCPETQTYHGVPDTFGGAKGRGRGGSLLGDKGGSAGAQESDNSSELGHGGTIRYFTERGEEQDEDGLPWHQQQAGLRDVTQRFASRTIALSHEWMVKLMFP